MPDNLLQPSLPKPATPAPPTPPPNLTPPALGQAPTNPFRTGGSPTSPAGGNGVSVPTPQVTPPTPAPAPTPNPAAPMGPGPMTAPQPPQARPANSFTLPSWDDVRRAVPALGDPVGTIGRGIAGSTTTPPLVGAGLTSQLPGSIQGPAEGVLRFAQRNFQDNPGLFSQVVGGLGKPIIEPLLGTPAGLPMMAGLYGMMTGGESGRAAYDFFRPVIDRLS